MFCPAADVATNMNAMASCSMSAVAIYLLEKPSKARPMRLQTSQKLLERR
jgi:hypothetical protein